MNQTQEDYVLDAVFVVNLLFFRSFIPSSPISVLVLSALASALVRTDQARSSVRGGKRIHKTYPRL